MIQETKTSSDVITNLTRNWGRDYRVIAMNAQGQSSDLSIIWNPQEILILNMFSSFQILASHFQLIGSTKTWYMSNVYEFPSHKDKYLYLQPIGITYNPLSPSP